MFSLKVDDELELVLLEEAHAEPLITLIDANRERLRPWMPWVDSTVSAADVRTFIRDSRRQYAENAGFAVGLQYRHQLCGCSGLKINQLNQRAEIGYWIAEAFEGRGIVTRAAQALTRYALDTLQLHRVAIHCAPANHRSCAVPERLGFTLEGVLREYFRCGDEYQDMRIYSYLAAPPQR